MKKTYRTLLPKFPFRTYRTSVANTPFYKGGLGGFGLSMFPALPLKCHFTQVPIEKLWERCYGKFTFFNLPNWEIMIDPIVRIQSNLS
jgi:hypothetical protein